eukprot:7878906-Lingulodinium_polyedra.AAC.1
MDQSINGSIDQSIEPFWLKAQITIRVVGGAIAAALACLNGAAGRDLRGLVIAGQVAAPRGPSGGSTAAPL